MGGKHRNWHRAWRRDAACPDRLLHNSGLVAEYDETLDSWVAAEESCEAWVAWECARGVPLHDLTARLMRLCKEAAMFAAWEKEHEKNQHGRTSAVVTRQRKEAH